MKKLLLAIAGAVAMMSTAFADATPSWWVSPGVVATNGYIKQAGDGKLFKSDWQGDYIAAQYGMIAAAIGSETTTKTSGFCLFKASDFLAGDNVAPLYSIDRITTEAKFGMGPYGATVSPVLKVALVSSGKPGQPALAIPIDKETITDDDVVVITNSLKIGFGAMGFSADGKYLYSEEYDGGTNTKVARWTVVDGLKTAGEKLVLDKEFSTGDTRIRNLQVVNIGGKDLIYCLLNGTSGVKVLDPSANEGEGSVTTLLESLPSSANYGGITVSGYATSTPRLVISTAAGGGATHLLVYTLAEDGLSLASETPVLSLTSDELKSMWGVSCNNYACDVLGSADDATLVYGGTYSGTLVLQTTPSFSVTSGETTTDYYDFATALAAMNDGDTLTFLKNQTLSARYEVAAAGKAITIDLNGKTITPTASCGNGSAFDIKSGTVTITNGTINAVGVTTIECDPITVRSGAAANLMAGLTILINTRNGACVYPFDGGLVNIYGGTYDNQTLEDYQWAVGIKGMPLNQANVATQLIYVYGGSFRQYNPANGDDAGLCTTFLASGYQSVQDGDYWVVSKIPPVAKIGDVEYSDLREALVAAKKGQTVELLKNVDLASEPWEPVFDFPATFDGKGFEIQNLVITNGHDRTGLICMKTWSTTSGTIKNITLRNVDVTGEDYVGALLGNNTSGGVISNVTVCGTIKVSGGWWVGGVVGHAEYGKIVDCHVNGDAESVIGREDAGQVGGIFGIHSEGSGNVTFGCTVANVKLLGQDRVGGIAGRNLTGSRVCACQVSDVVVQGDYLTNALNKVGGIVGEVYKGSDATMILNCTAANVTLKDFNDNVVAYRDYGNNADQDGYNFVTGTVQGESIAYNQSNYKLTNGTVKIQGGASTLTKVADICKPGYGLVATETAGTWKIENVTPITATLKGKNTASINLPSPMPTPGQTLKFTMTAKSGCTWIAFVNGKKATVSGNNISYATDISETEVEIYVAAVKSTAWYLDPFAKNTWNYGYAYNDQLSDAIMDENDEFLFLAENQHQFNNTNTGCYQYDVATIKGYIGAYYGTPVTGTTKKWHNAQDNFRRIMPSAAHQALFIGNGWASAEGVRYDNCSVFPFGGDWGDSAYGGTAEGDERYYIAQSDIGNKVDQYQRVDPGCFSADGKYFYAGVYARRQISKVEIVKDETGKITLLRPCGSSIMAVPEPLTNVTTEIGIRWPLTDDTKPQGMTAATLGGVERVYASLADGSLVLLNNSGDTALGEEDNGERDYTVLAKTGVFCSMRVTGKKAGLPHLTCQTRGGDTYIYELADDGATLVSTTPIFTFNAQTDLANLYNAKTGFWHVTTLDDESLAFANYRGGYDGCRSMVVTLEKRPAKMTVRTTLTTYNEGTSVQVNYNAKNTTILTANEGRKLISVKVNGAAVAAEDIGETAYTNTTSKLTKNLYIEAVEGYTIPEPIIAGNKGSVTVDNKGKDVAASGTISGKVTGITKGFTALVTVAGVPVTLGSDGKFSTTAANGAQVMVAFVKENAWYLNPFVKNDVGMGVGTHGNLDLADVAMDENEQNLFIALSRYQYETISTDFGAANGMYQYGVAAIKDYIGAYAGTPIVASYGKRTNYISKDSESFRYIYPSAALGVVIAGQGYAAPNNGNSTVWPFGKWWGDANYPVEGETVDARYVTTNLAATSAWDKYGRIAPFCVTADGKYIYMCNYARAYIHKANIVKDENGKVVDFTPTGIAWKLAETSTGVQVDGMAMKTVGDKDIVFVATRSGKLLRLDGANDTEAGEKATVEVADLGGTCRMMKITGGDTPHLICNVAAGVTGEFLWNNSGTGVAGAAEIEVFALSADCTTLLAPTPIAVVNGADLVSDRFQSFATTEDETLAFANYNYNRSKSYHVAVLTARPENVIVRGTFTTYEEGVNTNIAYGAAAEVTFAAPKGKKITAVKVNGVADTTFTDASYTFTDAALTKNVYIQMTTEDLPVAEIGTTRYVSINDAFAAVNGQTDADVVIKILRDFTEELTTDYIFTNNVTITTDVEGGVTADLVHASTKDPLYAVIANNSSKLTIDENVTITGFGQLFAGYGKGSGNTLDIAGDVTAAELWAFKGGTLNILPTAKVVAAYGDGMIKLRYDATLNVEGTGTDEVQFDAGYFSADYGGTVVMNLSNTYVKAGWLSDNASGSFSLNLTDARLVLGGGLDFGTAATGTINMNIGSFIKAVSVSNVDAVNIDAKGIVDPVKVIECTGSGAMTLESFGTVTVTGDAVAYVDGNDLWVAKAGVKIGTVYYLTLNDALNAAKAGDEVTLCQNAELSGALTIGKAVGINLNGKTLTPDPTTAFGIVINEDATITNGTITSALTANVAGSEMIEINDADVVFKDLTVNAAFYEYGIAACANRGSDLSAYYTAVPEMTVACTNVAVTGNGALIYAQCAYVILDEDCSAIYNNGPLFDNASHRAAIYSAVNALVTIAGGTYTHEKALLSGNLGGKIVANGGAFNGQVYSWMDSTAHDDLEQYEDYIAQFLLNGGTYTGEIAFFKDDDDGASRELDYFKKDAAADVSALTLPEGYIWNDEGELVKQAPAPTTVVAKIGDVEYTDLRTALLASSTNDTVQIVADIDLGNNEWTPVEDFIGTVDGGVYDENGVLTGRHVIKNLKVTKDGDYAGMFGNKGNTFGVSLNLKNITFENIDLTGQKYVGVVAEWTGKGSNVVVTGTIKVVGTKYVAALAAHGYVDLIDCHVDGVDKSKSSIVQIEAADKDHGQAGALVGMMCESHKTANCSAKNLTITGVKRIGGIAGRYHEGASGYGCFVSNVDITSGDTALKYTGAIVGEMLASATHFFANNTFDGVTINGASESLPKFGSCAADCNVAYTTQDDAVWDAAYKFSAGTFALYGSASLNALKKQVVDGYEVVAGEGDTYVVQAIPSGYDVTFTFSDTVTSIAYAITGGESGSATSGTAITVPDGEKIIITPTAAESIKIPVFTSAIVGGSGTQSFAKTNVYESAGTWAITATDASSESTEPAVQEAQKEATVESIGGTDEQKVEIKKNIDAATEGTGAPTAAEVAGWAETAKPAPADMATASTEQIQLSVDFGTEALVAAEDAIKIDELEATTTTAEDKTAFNLTFEFQDKQGDIVEATKAAKSKIEAIVKATSDLGDWTGDAKLTPTISADGSIENGAIKFKIELPKTNTKAFMKIEK